MASAEVALPRRPENITFVRSSLLSKEIPTNAFERYLNPAAKVGSLDSPSESTLPVVDLAGLRTGDRGAREEIARQLGKAATEWGFFQVINHGISDDKLNELQQRSREFFELPVEVKERGEDAKEMLYGYNGRFTYRHKETPWLESLSQWYRPNPDVESLAKKIWPSDGNPTFCNLVNECVQGTESLALLLLELLSESLGLKADTLSKYLKDVEKNTSAYRLHRYPSCPYPSSCFGAAAHSDTGILTIVKQDAVGGLQVRDGEGFVDAKPIPGALVVNVGDQLEVWSGGRFKSCEHRVVVNGESDRYSMIFLLLGGPKDFKIQYPPELIDEDHPSLYIPYTYEEYRANFESLLKRGKLDRKEVLTFALRKTQDGQASNL